MTAFETAVFTLTLQLSIADCTMEDDVDDLGKQGAASVVHIAVDNASSAPRNAIMVSYLTLQRANVHSAARAILS